MSDDTIREEERNDPRYRPVTRYCARCKGLVVTGGRERHRCAPRGAGVRGGYTSGRRAR